MLRFKFTTRAASKDASLLLKGVMAVMVEFFSDEDLIYKLKLALTEAVANVVDHAYPDGDGDVRIVLDLEPGKKVAIRVIDYGAGQEGLDETRELPDQESESGRGIFLMQAIADTLEFREEPDSKTLYLEINIGEEKMENVTIERNDENIRVLLSGEFNFGLVNEIKKELIEELTSADVKHVVADLSRVKFMDSTGIGFFVSLNNQLRNASKNLVLFKPSDQVIMTLKLVKLDAFFQIVEDEDELDLL